MIYLLLTNIKMLPPKTFFQHKLKFLFYNSDHFYSDWHMAQ